jgi:hypothetical protein
MPHKADKRTFLRLVGTLHTAPRMPALSICMCNGFCLLRLVYLCRVDCLLLGISLSYCPVNDCSWFMAAGSGVMVR